MKKILLLFITLISLTISQAQIVNIPDGAFKQTLLRSNTDTLHRYAKDLNGNFFAVDANNDGEIQISEAENVSYLDINSKGISNLIGIDKFINLVELNCSKNYLTNLNLDDNTLLSNLNCKENNLSNVNFSNYLALTQLDCSKNYFSNINISNNLNLTHLDCSRNILNTIIISNNIDLIDLNCNRNNINTIDLSNNIYLTHLDCSRNDFNTIDISNNTSLIDFDCGGNNLSILDISNNLNLNILSYWGNNISTLDISNHILLNRLTCHSNNISNLDISNNTLLNKLICSNNNLTNLDVSNLNDLTYLQCDNNNLSTLDLSNNTDLFILNCNDNLNLYYINLKNGNNNEFNTIFSSFNPLPNLEIVCLDETNSSLTDYIISEISHSVTFTEDCSFVPIESNQINGNIKLDLNSNGCDISDLSMFNLMIVSNNGTESFATFTQNNGDYLLYTNEGNFTTEITTNLPNYYSANPNLETNTFTDFGNTFTADFCVEPNQTVNDININIIPISQARPGFNTTYQIVYKNVGTTQLNGNATLEFDDTKLSFLNASETVNTQTSNSLTFNYSNLNPFETRTIDLEFNVFAPPTVNIDDVLSFTATINPIASDFTTDDNIFTFNQTVIGSYDPNDITCLEGDEILLEDADKYLHYVIRFQNTGTASAINVVVTNDLDANLDWSTLQLESLSHNNRVAIKNGNEIEFIFENINLPDSTTDEPNSHGFIAYKIKPKTDIALGDIIPNKADIFFDFNAPIETNIATTTIVNALAVNENTLLNFSVYPTPAESILNVKSKTEIVKIEIYSKLGQKIKETTENKVDISNLTQGLYFVKVKDVNGNFGVKKIVKK